VAIIEIVSGILTIFVLPFGYICSLNYVYAEYTLRKDMVRMKEKRLKDKKDYMMIQEYKDNVSNS